jgi:hypothetical protein
MGSLASWIADGHSTLRPSRIRGNHCGEQCWIDEHDVCGLNTADGDLGIRRE